MPDDARKYGRYVEPQHLSHLRRASRGAGPASALDAAADAEGETDPAVVEAVMADTVATASLAVLDYVAAVQADTLVADHSTARCDCSSPFVSARPGSSTTTAEWCPARRRDSLTRCLRPTSSTPPNPRGIGKQGKGSLAHLHPQHLGSTVLKALQERTDSTPPTSTMSCGERVRRSWNSPATSAGCRRSTPATT